MADLHEPRHTQAPELFEPVEVSAIQPCSLGKELVELGAVEIMNQCSASGGALVAASRAAQLPPSQSPLQQALRRESAEAWVARIAALPERYRAAIVLRHVDGLSYPEMSEALGRPEGTVKAQVHRGLALLRDALAAAEREESIA